MKWKIRVHRSCLKHSLQRRNKICFVLFCFVIFVFICWLSAILGYFAQPLSNFQLQTLRPKKGPTAGRCMSLLSQIWVTVLLAFVLCLLRTSWSQSPRCSILKHLYVQEKFSTTFNTREDLDTFHSSNKYLLPVCPVLDRVVSAGGMFMTSRRGREEGVNRRKEKLG